MDSYVRSIIFLSNMENIVADIEKMTLPELREHRKAVDALISQREVEDRQKAIEAARQAAKQLGFDINDLFGGSRQMAIGGEKKARKPVEPKYAHPENASVTWSGRGRQPDWFKDAIKEGKTDKDLLIK